MAPPRVCQCEAPRPRPARYIAFVGHAFAREGFVPAGPASIVASCWFSKKPNHLVFLLLVQLVAGPAVWRPTLSPDWARAPPDGRRPHVSGEEGRGGRGHRGRWGGPHPPTRVGGVWPACPSEHTPTPKAAKSHSLCLRACAPAERSATPQPTPLVCTPPVHSPRGGGSDGWTARHASAARRTCWQAYTLRGAVRARRWRDTAAAASAPASPTPLCGEAIVPPSPHPPRRGRSCLIDKRVKCCVHGTDCLLLRLSTW